MNKFLSIIAFLSCPLFFFGQTVFTVSNPETDQSVQVDLEEFKYVYFKNAPDEPTQDDVNDYLQRYVNFKLKVQEAYRQEYHTKPNIVNEIETYHAQLQKSYLEKSIATKLGREAHERKSNDINVSHILIRCGRQSSPEDTLAAYQKIQKAYKKLNSSGSNFDQIALKYSEDKTVQDNKGNLGYLSSLMIPYYAFENVMYSTPEGEYSKPFRTKMGYHIIRVNDIRPTLGVIDAAHILISSTDQLTAIQQKEKKQYLEAIRDSILNGEYSFEEAAEKFSDDQNTKSRGGNVGTFTVGKMVPSFELAAYNLKLPGDISPVFKTQFGFHILKLLGKEGPKPYELEKEFYEERVTLDARYGIVRDAAYDSVMQANNFVIDSTVWNQCNNLMNKNLQQSLWKIPQDWPSDKVILSTKNASLTAQDFGLYILYSQKKFRSGEIDYLFNRHWEKFLKRQIMDEWFSDIHDDYKFLAQEYKEGILLFELTDDNVWSKATEDTAGLKMFYEQADHSKYQFQDRYGITKYTISKDLAEEQTKLMKKLNKKVSKGLKYAKKKEIEIPSRYFTEQVEQSNFKLEDSIQTTDSQTSIYTVEFLPAREKALNEAKGFYVADYQSFLEQEWINELRSQYQVTINEEVLNEVLQ